MKFQLKKVAPYVYDVPCTLGQGSWHCGCPLKAGGYALKDIKYALPDLGVLGAVMAVSTVYFHKVTIYFLIRAVIIQIIIRVIIQYSF